MSCDRCWPANAEAAWEARKGLTSVVMLVDESHFIVSIFECPSCGQRFVSSLVEDVDWTGGDDAQFWSLIPITPIESEELAGQTAELTESKVADLGRGRRVLRRDYPTGGSARVYWSPPAP